MVDETAELKACPFCGGDDATPFYSELPTSSANGPKGLMVWTVFCQHCEAEGPHKVGLAEACEGWNVAFRPAPAVPQDMADFIMQLRGHAMGLKEAERYPPNNRSNLTNADSVSYGGLIDQAADMLAALAAPQDGEE